MTNKIYTASIQMTENEIKQTRKALFTLIQKNITDATAGTADKAMKRCLELMEVYDRLQAHLDAIEKEKEWDAQNEAQLNASESDQTDATEDATEDTGLPAESYLM